MEDFTDHNVVARAAAQRRAAYVGHPEQRDRLKKNTLMAAAALREAQRLMADNEHLEVIVEVMCESISDEVEKYAATFIPKGNDDDLWRAFLNITENCGEGDLTEIDEKYFARLDAALAEFKREHLSLFDE